jgi:diguanylate cyclase (GGDEF)-like protein
MDSRDLQHYSEPTAVTQLIVICAVAGALLTAACAAVVVWRTRATADARVADAVQRLASGMQETMRDLAGAVESAQLPASDRFAGELAASLDVDEVALRTLEAVAAIPGVDAAALDAGGVQASVSMAPDEAEKTILRVPENDNLGSVQLAYRYRVDETGEQAALVRTGVVVPLRADGLVIGTLSAFSRVSDRELSPEDIAQVELLACRAGPALENARRYAEARALADLDALTGLHNRRFFHETLAREVARGLRYERKLALIVIDLDDFKSINDRVGHLAGDGVLAEAAQRLLSVVRTADIPSRIGGDEFAVVLPESGAEDGQLLADRIAHAIALRPIANAGTLQLSAGVAELRAGDRPNQLFERADEALYRAKELGKARTLVANGRL